MRKSDFNPRGNEVLTKNQLKALMAKLSTEMELDRPTRIRLYQKIFTERYVCPDHDIPFVSTRLEVCIKCHQKMKLMKPHSTLHITLKEASILLDAFNKEPEKTRQRILNLVGWSELPFVEEEPEWVKLLVK